MSEPEFETLESQQQEADLVSGIRDSRPAPGTPDLDVVYRVAAAGGGQPPHDAMSLSTHHSGSHVTPSCALMLSTQTPNGELADKLRKKTQQ